jgi:DMSO/TMAO reductase YedYZ heme-binding membrane subunit
MTLLDLCSYLGLAAAGAASLNLLLGLLISLRFRVFDILLPIQSPLQPLINVAGASAMYLLLLVFVTSLFRSRIGRPLWRRIHYLVFPAAVLLFLHSFLTDPDLKDGHPDLLDGGKVFVEILALICFLAVALRIRLRGQGLRATGGRTRASVAASRIES